MKSVIEKRLMVKSLLKRISFSKKSLNIHNKVASVFMLELGSARVNGPAFAAEKLGYTSASFKYNINHTHALMEICTVYYVY